MLERVKRTSLSDAVFEQLRDRIVAGQFAPGEELPGERQLSETFGVNRGALREALKRLEQARLVAIQHGGATKVLDYKVSCGLDLLAHLLLGPSGTMNWNVARSVIELRSALAPDIARLAAVRGGAKTADALDEIVLEMTAHAEDPAALQKIAMRFWSALVDGSDNLAYRLSLNTLREVYSRIEDLLTAILTDELSDLAGYRAVAKAVRAGDGAKAARRAQTIVERGAKNLLTAIEAMVPQPSRSERASLGLASAGGVGPPRQTTSMPSVARLAIEHEPFADPALSDSVAGLGELT